MKPIKRKSFHPKDYSPTEHAEQVAFVQWFELTYPNYLLFAIPNGEKRGIHAAVRLKREGVRAGLPDLFIAQPRGLYGGLFIEMKRKGVPGKSKGVVNPIQKEMHRRLIAAAYEVKVCYGCDEAIAVTREYLDAK